MYTPLNNVDTPMYLSLSLSQDEIEIVKFDNHSNFYFYFLLNHLKTPHLHDWREFFVTKVGPMGHVGPP